jgi:transposase
MARTIPDSLDARAQSGAMDDSTDPDPEVPERARGPRRYSAKYKAQIDEYEQLDKAGKGALLRREGLYTSLISEWPKQRDLVRSRRWPSRPGASRRIPATGRLPGCVARTSA